MATPQLPKNWGRIETVTIGYGHGLALAPLQFAAGMAALVNGGARVTPTLMAAIRRRRRAAARRLGGHQRQAARDHAPQRDEPARHRPARRGRGLSRRRQDRHGRDAGPRRLPGEVRHLLLRRRLPDGRAALRGAGDAVRAAGPATPAATTSRPASTPPPPPPAWWSASPPCSPSCLGASRRAAAGGPRLTPHPRHNKKPHHMQAGLDSGPDGTSVVRC